MSTDDDIHGFPNNISYGLGQTRLSRLWYGDNIQKPTVAELEEAHHHAELEAAHDAPLAHPADGHQFDGRHGVDEEPMSRHEHSTTKGGPGFSRAPALVTSGYWSDHLTT